MKTKLIIIGLAALALAAFLVAAEETKTERIVVPFSNPAKAGRLEVENVQGGIKVIGTEGKEVIIEAKARDKAVGAEDEVEIEEAEDDQDSRAAKARAQAKAAGMKSIPLEKIGLTAEEEDNVVSLEVESWKRPMDLVIRVPFNTSLSLETMGGEITVENISGEIEVENVRGSVVLSAVSGSVSASTNNGDVKVVLNKVAPNKPMAFSTLNGDLDVTFPADIKANIKIDTERGEVYSDFDIAFKQVPEKSPESARKEGGRFRISLDDAYYGTINGGGPEYQFENFNGNIYIRMKK